MKKILLLGGSAQQVIAIKTAKNLGMYTVLCDYLPDNPGQYVADRFYLISTTDKEGVLNIAKKENIAGVLAYASDPAAPTAAYVAQKLGLPTNPYDSVEILCNKDKFRRFLGENGFNAPISQGYDFAADALKDTKRFRLPVIVKPTDSSGSKGATVLYKWDNLEEAIGLAFHFSKGHRIIMEEFVKKKHPYLIGGDIFVLNGKVVLWGLMNCHRDSDVNPLVPVGKSYPLELSISDLEAVKQTLQAMINKLGILFGAVNVELVIDDNNQIWPIDVGPRAGGNMIPELLSIIFGIDIVEMSIKAAIGDKLFSIYPKEKAFFYATHNLHSKRDGIYQEIQFSNDIEKYIIKKNLYKKAGDKVEYFDNASKALGIIFMKFDNQEEMKKILLEINNHIKIILKPLKN